jgi:hypothetical protein
VLRRVADLVVAQPVTQPQPHHRAVGVRLIGRQAGHRVDRLKSIVKILLHSRVEVDQRDLDLGQWLRLFVAGRPARPMYVKQVRPAGRAARIKHSTQRRDQVRPSSPRLADNRGVTARKHDHLGVAPEAH